MKLVVVAGGGGHFAAALSVIQALPKEWEVLVVGRKYVFEGDKTLALEYQTTKKLGIPFQSITTGRLQRSFTQHTLSSLVKVPIGFYQAYNLLISYKPDVVVSFGGYVSVPVVIVAALLKIPIVVHEQVVGVGLANKIAAKFAYKICISWKESKQYFPESKVILTGNPIRKEFLQKLSSSATQVTKKDALPMIYVTGGSSGAHALNILVEGCLERLLQRAYVIHQTGDAKVFGDFHRLEQLRKSLPPVLQKRYQLLKFVSPDKVAGFIQQADLVISRSGVNTVTELLSIGTPCLLIPLPYGQRNEQLTNAIVIKRTGLAEVAQQDTLTIDSFYTLVHKMIHNKDEYKKNAAAARKLIIRDAAEKIIEVIKDVSKQKEQTKA